MFACTSDALFDTSVARPYPPLCNLTAASHASRPGGSGTACMDVVNTVQCWTSAHMLYALPPLVLLPVYYVCALHMKAAAQVIPHHAVHARVFPFPFASEESSATISSLCNSAMHPQAKQSAVVTDRL